MGKDGGKRLRAAEPIHKRLLFCLAAASIQNVVIGPAMAYRHVKQRISPPESYPTLVKTYTSRPKLPVRIFFPKSYDRKSPRPLPLLFSIHGGGFVVGDPSDNDLWNFKFCEGHTALVVALNYAKAPANAFPGPRLDLEAQIAAVLADPDLTPHIDPAKVAITGFSAGGSLTMTVSEAPAVRDKITAGIVPIYPVTDLSLAPEQKAKTRRYKPKLAGSRGRDKDPLLAMAGLFDWSCKSFLFFSSFFLSFFPFFPLCWKPPSSSFPCRHSSRPGPVRPVALPHLRQPQRLPQAYVACGM